MRLVFKLFILEDLFFICSLTESNLLECGLCNLKIHKYWYRGRVSQSISPKHPSLSSTRSPQGKKMQHPFEAMLPTGMKHYLLQQGSASSKAAPT